MKYLFKDCKTVTECEVKLNALIESWPVVYLDEDPRNYDGSFVHYACSSEKDEDSKLRAFLMFIEEIVKEPCKHEPDLDKYGIGNGNLSTRCKHCNVELQATWTAK